MTVFEKVDQLLIAKDPKEFPGSLPISFHPVMRKLITFVMELIRGRERKEKGKRKENALH